MREAHHHFLIPAMADAGAIENDLHRVQRHHRRQHHIHRTEAEHAARHEKCRHRREARHEERNMVGSHHQEAFDDGEADQHDENMIGAALRIPQKPCRQTPDGAEKHAHHHQPVHPAGGTLFVTLREECRALVESGEPENEAMSDQRSHFATRASDSVHGIHRRNSARKPTASLRHQRDEARPKRRTDERGFDALGHAISPGPSRVADRPPVWRAPLPSFPNRAPHRSGARLARRGRKSTLAQLRFSETTGLTRVEARA